MPDLENLKDNSEGVPEGTVIGTTAKGLELKTRAPLLVSGMNGRQLLEKLNQKAIDQPGVGGKATLYPIEPYDFTGRHISELKPPKWTGMIGTCIASLEDLGHIGGLRTPQLSDPKIIEQWNTLLRQEYRFERLPQTTLLDLALAGPQKFAIRPDGHVDVPRYEVTSSAQRSVNSLPDGLLHGLHLDQGENRKFYIQSRDTNPEFKWNSSDRFLLGVRKL